MDRLYGQAAADRTSAELDAGADLYCGHSAHIFQGIELRDGKPILYDMFVDDYSVDEYLRNDQSLLFFATITKHGVREVKALPVLIEHCQVNVSGRADFEQISARLRALSAELGTVVEEAAGFLRVVGKMATQGA